MLGNTFKEDEIPAKKQQDRFHGIKVNTDLLLCHDTGGITFQHLD
jgi:hypothetical protein